MNEDPVKVLGESIAALKELDDTRAAHGRWNRMSYRAIVRQLKQVHNVLMAERNEVPQERRPAA